MRKKIKEAQDLQQAARTNTTEQWVRLRSAHINYFPPSEGPFNCGHCAFLDRAKGFCQHKEVRAYVEPEGCCNEFKKMTKKTAVKEALTGPTLAQVRSRAMALRSIAPTRMGLANALTKEFPGLDRGVLDQAMRDIGGQEVKETKISKKGLARLVREELINVRFERLINEDAYRPFTGQACHCRPGMERDNCPDCEGTGKRIDFAKIRAANKSPEIKKEEVGGNWNKHTSNWGTPQHSMGGDPSGERYGDPEPVPCPNCKNKYSVGLGSHGPLEFYGCLKCGKTFIKNAGVKKEVGSRIEDPFPDGPPKKGPYTLPKDPEAAKVAKAAADAAKERGKKMGISKEGTRESPRCPKCGSTGAWDGSRCHYCEYKIPPKKEAAGQPKRCEKCGKGWANYPQTLCTSCLAKSLAKKEGNMAMPTNLPGSDTPSKFPDSTKEAAESTGIKYFPSHEEAVKWGTSNLKGHASWRIDDTEKGFRINLLPGGDRSGRKHYIGVDGKPISETAPKGWEGTVKAMKKHKDIDNPFALANYMKDKGYKSHKKEVKEAGSMQAPLQVANRLKPGQKAELSTKYAAGGKPQSDSWGGKSYWVAKNRDGIVKGFQTEKEADHFIRFSQEKENVTRLREAIRRQVRKALTEATVVSPPGQRPAPQTADHHRSAGETWHDGRYDEPYAAKNKDGHVRRYKSPDKAKTHSRSNTEKKVGET